MKAYRVIELLIGAIKKQKYRVNYSYTYIDVISILFPKFLSLIRGMVLLMPRLGSSQGLVFVEPNVRVFFAKNLFLGRTVLIKNGACINALCKNKIIIGDNFSLGENSNIDCVGTLNDIGEKLTIGNNVGLNRNCYISVRGEIDIGNDVILGPGVSIFSENHLFSELATPIRLQGIERYKTTIGSNVWIGANASVMGGVTVGNGCVVAAGCVVTKDVPDHSIVAGVPGRVIKSRK